MTNPPNSPTGSTTPPTSESKPSVDTGNEFWIVGGENLGNHSTAMAGRAKFVQCGHIGPIVFRTNQQLYRFMAWATLQAEMQQLPDEDGEHSYEEVLEAIKNV